MESSHFSSLSYESRQFFDFNSIFFNYSFYSMVFFLELGDKIKNVEKWILYTLNENFKTIYRILITTLDKSIS